MQLTLAAESGLALSALCGLAARAYQARRRQRYLDAALEASTHAILIFASNGRIAYVNPVAAAAFGLTAGHLKRRRWDEAAIPWCRCDGAPLDADDCPVAQTRQSWVGLRAAPIGLRFGSCVIPASVSTACVRTSGAPTAGVVVFIALPMD